MLKNIKNLNDCFQLSLEKLNGLKSEETMEKEKLYNAFNEVNAD